MRKCEAGFSLIELLVGAGIGVFVLWGLVAAVDRLARSSDALNERLVAESDAERLVERLSAESASAWAVWAPTSTSVAFYAQDGAHRPYTWSYVFDPERGTVTRSTGDVFGTFTTFTASAASSTGDPLFAQSRMPAVAYAFPGVSGAIGGNGAIAVHVVGTGVDRTILVSSGTAPTAFTVVIRYTPSPTPLVTPTPVPLR